MTKGEYLQMKEVLILWGMVVRAAKEKWDGHYTILGSTTGCKVFFGTPTIEADLQNNEDGEGMTIGGEYGQLARMPGGMSLEEALRFALATEPTFQT